MKDFKLCYCLKLGQVKRENLKTVSNQSKIKRVKSQKVAEVKSITSMVLASKGECEKLSAFYHFEFITR